MTYYFEDLLLKDFEIEDHTLSMPCNCTFLPPEVEDLPILRKAGHSEKMTDKE